MRLPSLHGTHGAFCGCGRAEEERWAGVGGSLSVGTLGLLRIPGGSLLPGSGTPSPAALGDAWRVLRQALV